MLSRIKTWLLQRFQTHQEQEQFLRLVQVMQEDSSLRKQVLLLLEKPTSHRRRALDHLIAHMQQQRAPKAHLGIVAYLYHDDLCETLRKHLQI